jgi:hypothetical protein
MERRSKHGTYTNATANGMVVNTNGTRDEMMVDTINTEISMMTILVKRRVLYDYNDNNITIANAGRMKKGMVGWGRDVILIIHATETK